MKVKVVVALSKLPLSTGNMCVGGVWEDTDWRTFLYSPFFSYSYNLNLATRLTSPCWINLLYSVNLDVLDVKYHLLNPLHTKAYLLLIFKICFSAYFALFVTEKLCITIKTIELSHPRLLCGSFLGFKRMLHHSSLLELLHGPKNGSQISSVVVHRENKPCPIDSLYCQADFLL